MTKMAAKKLGNKRKNGVAACKDAGGGTALAKRAGLLVGEPREVP